MYSGPQYTFPFRMDEWEQSKKKLDQSKNETQQGKY